MWGDEAWPSNAEHLHPPWPDCQPPTATLASHTASHLARPPQVVTNKLAVSEATPNGEVYVLVPCGVEPPSADAFPAGTKFFTVPLTSLSAPETVPYAFVVRGAAGAARRRAPAVALCPEGWRGCWRWSQAAGLAGPTVRCAAAHPPPSLSLATHPAHRSSWAWATACTMCPLMSPPPAARPCWPAPAAAAPHQTSPC